MPSKRLQRVTVKQNFISNEIILHVENYKNQQQHEVQSAYFGHSSFALFTACCYLRSMDGSLIKESLVVVTESPDYSRTLREKYFPAFGLNTEIYCKSLYSVQMRENTDKKKLRIWTLFTQWDYCIFLYLQGSYIHYGEISRTTLEINLVCME